MAEIQKVDRQSVIDYMARDYDSLLQSMRDQIPTKLPEWTDYTSEADMGNVLLQLFAHMGDILSYYQDRIANESFLSTAQTRRSIIQHLRLIGYRLSTASPAAAKLVLTVPTTVNEVLTISQGTAFATKSQQDKKSVRFEYTSKTSLTINCATLPLDPKDRTKKIYADGIPVEEGRLVKDEILGISEGKPNQRFTLSHAGVILRSVNTTQQVNQDILLLTEQGGIVEQWTLLESLAFSREQQRDFVVEIDDQDRATVIFGDGAFGLIPPSGCQIRVTYRVGGGTFGNVPANTIETLASAPDLARVGAKVTNPAIASGGADRESIEQAVMNAPKVFRSLKRAVTADDYKALALNFNGVSKVRAEPSNWNTVTLYIAPKGGGRVSDVLEADLLAYFEDKRPITTIIKIADVDYVKIYITATVGVESYYFRSEIQEKVKSAVTALLALENVDFKQTLYLSRFYETITEIAGVAYVNITEFRRQAAAADSLEKDGKIELGSNEIPIIPDDPLYANGLQIHLEGGG